MFSLQTGLRARASRELPSGAGPLRRPPPFGRPGGPGPGRRDPGPGIFSGVCLLQTGPGTHRRPRSPSGILRDFQTCSFWDSLPWDPRRPPQIVHVRPPEFPKRPVCQIPMEFPKRSRSIWLPCCRSLQLCLRSLLQRRVLSLAFLLRLLPRRWLLFRSRRRGGSESMASTVTSTASGCGRKRPMAKP